jgi:hypothetical protein
VRVESESVTYGNHRPDLQGIHQLARLYMISLIVSSGLHICYVRKPPPGDPPGNPPVGAATRRQDIVGTARHEQDLRKLGAPPGMEKGGKEKHLALDDGGGEGAGMG